MKKYCIHPGYVYSRDGDCHYISYPQLIRLYGLAPAECFKWTEENSRGIKYDEFIHLVPTYGNYREVLKEKLGE